MLHWLGYIFSEVGFFRLLNYISFRSLMAALTAFLIGILLGRRIINQIYNLKFRDSSRSFLEFSTHNKSGTPTMGGLLMLASFVPAILIWSQFNNIFFKTILFATFWFGCLGFIDDYLKAYHQNSDRGLNRTLKLTFQALFGLILAYLILHPASSPFSAENASLLYIPFYKFPVLELKKFFYLFAVLVVIAISNAINFADGLDGLATVPSMFVLGIYGVLAYISGNVFVSHYLLFPYIPGSSELVVIISALAGALAAFLWFNSFPAEIFMGDTGSQMLGGIIATVALLLKQELLFLIAGGVFVVEFLSVFLQDYIGIRLLKKRLLYRAPLHHTYQYMGYAEPKVVVRFWIVAAIFAIVSLISIKLR
jgi:phospho-N-acetylmuramoyl-pentapeptide-transferase